MHILFITDNFPPEVNAPASRTFEHCREWVKSGVDVTVITCAPNFPTGQVFKGYKNSIFPKYEQIDGIKVLRVWSYITSNQGFLKRSLDYISFMVSSIIFSSKARKVDIIIGTSPQFFTVCSAYVISIIKMKPYIFELRDLWPESISAVGAINNKYVLLLLEKIELFLYEKAKIIVSVTNAFKANLVSRGINENKIFVVTNGVDLNRFKPLSKDIHLLKNLGLENNFILGYIGTIGMAHSLEILLEVAKELEFKKYKKIKIIILGDGSNKNDLLIKANRDNIKNLIFLNSVSKELVPSYWSILDLSIIHLKNVSTFHSVIPSKLFECMAMGLPIVHGVKGESAKIVSDYDIGLLFEPEDSKSLTKSIIRLYDDAKTLRKLSKNSLVAAQDYSRVKLANNMLKILYKVIK